MARVLLLRIKPPPPPPPPLPPSCTSPLAQAYCAKSLSSCREMLLKGLRAFPSTAPPPLWKEAPTSRPLCQERSRGGCFFGDVVAAAESAGEGTSPMWFLDRDLMGDRKVGRKDEATVAAAVAGESAAVTTGVGPAAAAAAAVVAAETVVGTGATTGATVRLKEEERRRMVEVGRPCLAGRGATAALSGLSRAPLLDAPGGLRGGCNTK
mmetsp:Transcript_11496/g.34530  ORF Transcript_11496/g.34530 Transcript_11496/m.34530 type:complete len:209 (+) Transcript_11496:876-1502(+)